MFTSCTSLSSLFVDAVAADSLAETAFLELEPDRTRGTVLQRVDGVWSFNNAGQNDRKIVAGWCSSNSIAEPTTSNLAQLFKDDGAYGNVYLTGGEYALFIGYVYTYASYEMHNVQVSDMIDGLTETSYVKATIDASRELGKNGVNLTVVPTLGDESTFNPFFTIYTKLETPLTSYRVIGEHNKSNGINTESDLAAIRSKTDVNGQLMTVFWQSGNGRYISHMNEKAAVLYSDGTRQVIYSNEEVRREGITPRIACFGLYYDQDASKLWYSFRQSGPSWAPFKGWYEEWAWYDGSIDLDPNKQPVDILFYDQQNANDKTATPYFSGTWTSSSATLNASVPLRQANARIFRPGVTTPSSLEATSKTAWSSSATINYDGANQVSIGSNSAPLFNEINCIIFDGYVNSTAIPTYARRRAVTNVWTLPNPVKYEPTEIEGYVTAKATLTQTRNSRVYYVTGSDLTSNPTVHLPSRTVKLSVTTSYAESSTAQIIAWSSTTPRSWTDVIMSALAAADAFNADDILSSGDVEALVAIARTRYSTMDSYLAMYADYTANLVVDSIVNAMIASISTGRDEVTGVDEEGNDIVTSYRYPMESMYQFHDDTVVTVSGYSFSCKSLRESDDPVAIAAVCSALYQLQKDLDYKLTLFMEMHDAFNGVDALSNFAAKIQQKIRSLQSRAQLIMSARGVASEALLLNCAAQEVTYNKVSTVIQNAVAAGYSSLSDAINYIQKVAPDLGYCFTEDSVSGELYQSILSKTSYNNYKANILNPPK